MEFQPMTVIVNIDYGFPEECDSTTYDIKEKKNNQPLPTKLQWIVNAALILVLTNCVSHLTIDSAVLKIWFQWCNNSNAVSMYFFSDGGCSYVKTWL